MKTTLLTAALAYAWLGCSSNAGRMSTGDDGDGDNGDGHTSSAHNNTPDANGQTGSIGSSADECKQAKDCVARAEDELSALKKPVASPQTFSAAECIQLGVMAGAQSASGPACECSNADGGSLSVGPAGLGCFAYGRGGDCLWDDSEWSGCEVGKKDACKDVCAEFEKRIADDAARTFDTRVVYTACDAATMCHDVVEIDGRCYADRSYQNGRDYDCALGGEEILARNAEDSHPQMTEIPPRPTRYVAGTDGFIELISSTRFVGSNKLFTDFGADAQFFTTIGGQGVDYGEVLDPLEGVDDCGVTRSSGIGTTAPLSFIDIGQLALDDQDDRHRFELSSASHDDFYQYILDLSAAHVEPRYGENYGVSGGGGTFGEAIAFDMRLPEALTIEQLDTAERVERGALKLTWTGHGDAPLHVSFTVDKTLADFSSEPYTIDCLLEDDGEFEVPSNVLEQAPEGFMIAGFTREQSSLVQAGSKTVLTVASVTVAHHLALGKACDRSDVLDACRRAAKTLFAEYEKCGVEAPTLQEMCPAYLAEACGGCTEYFDCIEKQRVCGPDGLTYNATCSCPAPTN